ncbi:MAG: hypothetical protein QNJ46_06860 [Leptolyngbyaceae cyanobacterium MO_188.B28]|nr:hypothetical protein [Leptolyngbyaceae cyanobacterium MO_188.B28]
MSEINLSEINLSEVKPANIPLSNHVEALMELSETEQESLAGGNSLTAGFDAVIFQQTEINTFAEDQTNISNADGNLSASSLTRTGYSFRQTTLAFFSFGSGGGGFQNNPLSMIASFFRGLYE